MGRLVQQHWRGSVRGLTQRDRKPGTYHAFVPQPLCGREILLDGQVAAEISEAELAISRLNQTANALSGAESFARLLLRAEAMASSRIEGLQVSPQRLLKEEFAQHNFAEKISDTSQSILDNIKAMSDIVHRFQQGEDINLEQLVACQATLMGPHAKKSGLRQKQNWIGGGGQSPVGAHYVPPPPSLVPNLMDDLIGFCNSTHLSPVVQAGLAHAHFESIHPFVDGNGRTGRALIHLVLKRRGMCPNILLPVSLVLATQRSHYIQFLQNTRYVCSGSDATDMPESFRRTNMWLDFFGTCCLIATLQLEKFESDSDHLREGWRKQLADYSPVRRGSALDLLVDRLISTPLISIKSAADMIERSVPQVSKAVDRLLQAKILSSVRAGKRNRAFMAEGIIHLFTQLERQMASQHGDTKISKPTRPVPFRPQL